jgi:gluconolactonase
MERHQPLRLLDATPETEQSEKFRNMNRRDFMKLTAAAAVGVAPAMDALAQADRYSEGAPPTRYPEPDVIGLDKRFKYKLGNTPILRLYRGTMWAEGPAWNAQARCLVWSDIPNNEILRWCEEDGHVTRQFRYPSNNTNGNTFDYWGRQISFRHGSRDVVRFEHDGSVTVMAAKSPDGKEFNAPNDGATLPDNTLFFTDPGYGALMNYEGNRVKESAKSPAPYQKEAIYRCDEPGKVEKVADDPFKPNGLCFSPDYKKCYVADTGLSHYPNAKSVIWVYDVDGKKLKNPKTFANMEMNGKTGFADGIRCDEDGNVWAGMGWVGEGYDGVHVFAPDGTRIGQIKMPEIISNVCFGGSKRNRLFMTGSQSLYAVYVETRGGTIT